MSIIREALEKAQKNNVPHEKSVSEPEAEIQSAVCPKNTTVKVAMRSMVYGGLFIFVLSLVASKFFLTAEKPEANMAETNSSIHITEEMFDNTRIFGLTKAEEKEKYVLSGIMHLEDGPRAVINNVLLAKGESIAGAIVDKIYSDRVILISKDSEIVLRLK